MFLRETRRIKDGKEQRYWSVVENHRVGANRVVQRHVLYLGEIHGSQRQCMLLICRGSDRRLNDRSQNGRIMKKGSTTSLTIGKKLVFTLLLLTFSVLLAEISLQTLYRITAGQWLWQWWALPLYEPDDVRVYRVRSNLNYLHKTSEYEVRYYTNEQGFRTGADRKPVSIAKPEDVYRVLYLGPSFAFGWGVDYEQSYAYLIARNLRAPRRVIESVNAGVPAQPMNYQLAWLKREGYRYSPDLVVQTVYADCCVSMAEDGTIPKDVPYVRNNYLYPPAPKTSGEAIQQIVRHYRRYSALLFFGWRMYVAVAPGKERSGTGQELYRDQGGDDSCDQDRLAVKYHAYESFVWKALDRKVPIVFLYVPLAYIVRPADVVRVSHQGKQKNPSTERSLTKNMQKILTDNGIHFIDLTEVLVRNDARARMYRLYDIHFTPAGNQVAADTATPIIQKVIDDSL